jgi:cell division protein ZapA
MSTKNKIAVKILGQDHYLISTDEPDYVHKVAKLVDDRMQTILRANSSLSHTKIAILTALNLADDLSKSRKKIEELKLIAKPQKVELKETKNQIVSLSDQLAQTESLYENLLNELDMMRSARENQETQLRDLMTQLKGMFGDLEAGDEALHRATNRIAELEEQLLMRENEIAEYIRVFDEIENEKLQDLNLDDDDYMYDEDEIIYEEDLEEE